MLFQPGPEGRPLHEGLLVDGVAEQRILTSTGRYENAWIVTSGVEEGDVLILDGLTNLVAGMPVSPVPVEISEDGVVMRTDGKSEAFGAAGQEQSGGN